MFLLKEFLFEKCIFLGHSVKNLSPSNILNKNLEFRKEFSLAFFQPVPSQAGRFKTASP
jgi:hypothetical protein